MTLNFLKEFESLNKEIKDIEARIKTLDKTVVSDSVQASSKYFPYTSHTVKIQGIPCNSKFRNKYKKMLKNKKHKLSKLQLQLEYELNYIDNAEIREIIRLKYNDNLTWIQVMFKMNYNNENTARKKLNRYFNKKKDCN